MKKYDIVFIGHITIDEIVAAEGSSSGTGGGAPLFGSLAAAVTEKRIAVITRIAREDTYLIEVLEKSWCRCLSPICSQYDSYARYPPI